MLGDGDGGIFGELRGHLGLGSPGPNLRFRGGGGCPVVGGGGDRGEDDTDGELGFDAG